MTDTRTERHADAERLIALLSERASAPETLAEADWRRIVELAQEQGVAPMLYARLQTLGATLPAATAQQLREFYLACVMRNTWLFDEVGKILRALQAAGIPSQVVWQLLRRDKTLTAEARQEAHLRDYLGYD
jgi:light-regulated signal transduction histidine kinase (bacteriophytochrome)